MEDCRRRLFPTRLRELREARALDQIGLAARARLQASAISHYESGRRVPSLRNLLRLADALYVPIDYLVGRTPDNTKIFTSKLTAAQRDVVRDLVAVMEKRNQLMVDRDRGRE